MKKQKIRNTKNWLKARRKRSKLVGAQLASARRSCMVVDEIKLSSQTGAQWNYEPAEAWRGTVVVGKSEKPTWWCAGLEGTRRRCVKVQSWGEPFYIDDEDGRGSLKAFKLGGGPDSYHASIPVDDPSTFIQDQDQTLVLFEAEDIHIARAAEHFGIDPIEVTAEQRRVGKALNFHSAYSSSPMAPSRPGKQVLGQALPQTPQPD